MTKIKLCGLSRSCDVEAANALRPDYVGFVFAKTSKRAVTRGQAAKLKELLRPGTAAVGVFVKEAPETVADFLNSGIIDIAQLHGGEDEAYIRRLRTLTDKPLIQAFVIGPGWDEDAAENSAADYLLLDAGAGSGQRFDWAAARRIRRPYFLAGGLDAGNVGEAIRQCRPYAVDVSSGIETDGLKDREKMAAFAAAVRKETKL